MGKTKNITRQADDLIMRAMRLAEYAHRNRKGGPHHRKAPDGEDRPAYFIHLAEVAWMLQDSGLDTEVVAAGFLHDIIEDCYYSKERLSSEISNRRVAQLVQRVSEKKINPRTRKKISWETRNEHYYKCMCKASPGVRALSCADKTSNILDMCRQLEKGYRTQDFTKKNHAEQLKKFEDLETTYRGKVPRRLFKRFQAALDRFRGYRQAG